MFKGERQKRENVTAKARMGIIERQIIVERRLTAQFLQRKITQEEYRTLLGAVGLPPLNLRQLEKLHGK